MEERVKTCRDCVYYRDRYFRDGVGFMKIFQGHCTEKLGHKFRKADKLCECFVERDREQKRRDRVRNVAKSLSEIAYCMQGIYEVLKPQELNSEELE